MTVTRKGDRPRFSPQDLELLKAFCRPCSVSRSKTPIYIPKSKHKPCVSSHKFKPGRNDLAISENRYRALVETTITGVCQLDLDTRFTYVNKALADLLKVSTETIVNRRLMDTDFLSPASMKDAPAAFSGANGRQAPAPGRL